MTEKQFKQIAHSYAVGAGYFSVCCQICHADFVIGYYKDDKSGKFITFSTGERGSFYEGGSYNNLEDCQEAVLDTLRTKCEMYDKDRYASAWEFENDYRRRVREEAEASRRTEKQSRGLGDIIRDYLGDLGRAIEENRVVYEQNEKSLDDVIDDFIREVKKGNINFVYFYSIGSVVRVRQYKTPMMIVGYARASQELKCMYHYSAVPFPSGLTESNDLYGFNSEDIVEVIHKGLQNQQSEGYKLHLNNEYKREGDLG